MERASSGSTGSPPNSSESIYGLKFGKKIYFEDVGIGVQPKLSGGSSSVSGSGNPSSPVPVKKVKNGVVSLGNGSNNNPPRCQVEGCKVDLSDVKAYYSRHKVCAMHSKSSTVIVSGLEQRFCQQCSRFHQLTEFDQGKRSCRRRLAGHNKRRRKPTPGSLMPSRYGRLSSSVFETSGRGEGDGFVMDFASHPRLPERNLWPTTRSPERVFGNQAAVNGKFPSNPWENNSESPSNLFLQGSSNGNGFPAAPSFPLGDFFAGVTDSGCALSLLSNQHWGSSSRRRASDLEVSDFVHTEDATFGHPQAPPQVASGTHFSTTSWAYKGNEVASNNSHEMGSELSLVEMSQLHNSQFSCEFEPSSQRDGRQYMEREHSSREAYSSPSHHVHWSLQAVLNSE